MQTSRCLSFPSCSPLTSEKQIVERIFSGKKSYISAICQFLCLFAPLPLVVILESECIWLLPFRLSSGCPRWRLACTCHATCAVAAAWSWSASLPSAPRTAASPPPGRRLRDASWARCCHTRDASLSVAASVRNPRTWSDPRNEHVSENMDSTLFQFADRIPKGGQTINIKLFIGLKWDNKWMSFRKCMT